MTWCRALIRYDILIPRDNRQVYFDEILVNSSFSGYVYAELEDSPTDFELLRWGNGTVGPTRGTAQVTNGIAQFSVSMQLLYAAPSYFAAYQSIVCST
jgi:hypothetical protein